MWLIVDLLLVGVFAVVGRLSHYGSLTLAGWWETAWPFLAGTLLAWVLLRLLHRPGGLVTSGVVVWVVALVERHAAAPGQRPGHRTPLRHRGDPGARGAPGAASGGCSDPGQARPVRSLLVTDPATRTRAGALPFALLVAAIVLVSLNLRPGASSIGPVLQEVRDGLGMSAGVAGALTGLPGLCFGLAGALAVRFARRVGMTAGIALGLVAAAAGLLLRVTTDNVPLFLLLTVVALAGMAMGNVLVPAWIKLQGHTVALMTIYGTGLVLGGALGSLLTAPVTEATDSWRVGLGMWGLLVALALPLWLWLAVRARRPPHRPRRPRTSPPAAA